MAIPATRPVRENRTRVEAAPGRPVVVDVGRLRPASPAAELAARADVVVLVARPTVESLACLLPRLPLLASRARRLVVAVRGDGPYRLVDIATEVCRRAGTPIAVLAMPEDARAVDGLAGRRASRLDRTALMRAASRLSAVLEPACAREQREGPVDVSDAGVRS